MLRVAVILAASELLLSFSNVLSHGSLLLKHVNNVWRRVAWLSFSHGTQWLCVLNVQKHIAKRNNSLIYLYVSQTLFRRRWSRSVWCVKSSAVTYTVHTPNHQTTVQRGCLVTALRGLRSCWISELGGCESNGRLRHYIAVTQSTHVSAVLRVGLSLMLELTVIEDNCPLLLGIAVSLNFKSSDGVAWTVAPNTRHIDNECDSWHL